MIPKNTYSIATTVRRRFIRATGGSAVILMYHRIANLDSDPQQLAIPPELFREQMEMIAQEFVPVSMSRIVAALTEKRPLGRDWVAVTFDDGYLDNAQEAKPILEASSVPATFFVSTGRLEDTSEFWWDELDRLIFGTHPLPNRLVFGEGAEFISEGCATPESPEASWCVNEAPRSPRQALYKRLAAFLHDKDSHNRQQVLDQIRGQIGASNCPRPTHSHVGESDVRALASGITSVGAHTVSHPRLSGLSLDEQRSEILRSKETLQRITGGEVPIFAYPYGDPSSYTEATARIVKECGFQGAVATHQTIAYRKTDRFRIPRYACGNTSSDDLKKMLGWWLGR